MQKQRERTKVLMIYPLFPDSFWSFRKAVEILGKKATMPPTCLATIAAMLPKEYFEVLPILDLNIEPLLDDYIIKSDLIMLSAMIVQSESLEKIIGRIKHFGKMVAVGGPYATSYRDRMESMRYKNLILILNEAETTLSPFIEDWLQGCPKPFYDENSVRSRSKSALTKEGKPFITETPIPRWDLLKIDKYACMSVQFSRGCPFNCEFCDITLLYGHIPRTKTPEQLIAEIEALRALGWRGSVFIVDDNFIGNRLGVQELLPEIIKWQNKHNFPFSFFTEASLNLADDNMKDIRTGMVAAGFDKVFCGIESTNAEVLEKMGKSQNRGNIAEKVKILQKDGLEVIAGFIIGSDSDMQTVFDDIFKFLQNEGIVFAMVGLLTALRGTALYNRLQAEGRLRTESSGNNTHQISLNFKPTLDESFLIDGYIGLLDKLYSSENYYARCIKLREKLGSPHRSVPLNFSRILAAFRIFYRKLIKNPDWEFVKFILGTLFMAPRNMTVAIEQAVKLIHFQEITKEAVRVHQYPKQVEILVRRFKKHIAEIKGNADRRLRKLDKLEQKVIKQIRKMYESIHRDYRANVEKKPVDWQSEIDICANKHRQYWQSA
ncbi:MAG: radical domain iron-sulfur cluster-binding oxidoreductase with cobamide-binding-like domain [Parcubacteria group bacterium]|nr:radical domain iron-sulfur cluster-binding oxidoreductase with cobamide-binding-like domain [Parcubacteria group bacterium]